MDISSLRALVVLVVLLSAQVLLVCDLRAADPLEEAKARHAWTWFGLDEAAVQTEAKRRIATLVVARRDGKEQEPRRDAPADAVVMVHLQNGRVLWAMASTGGRYQMEGVADAALLPWLGLREQEVTKQATAAGRVVRVVARDGQDFGVTLDFNEQRLNLHVLMGVVVAITTG